MLATRIGEHAIIVPNMDERMGDNINGPSAMRAPSWLVAPLGKYYLYFADHDGDYIRLAYADELHGPWRIHTPGVLSLERSGFAGHIASPDVHVDHERQQIRMYFHGCDAGSTEGGEQFTRVAISKDGLNFEANPENLGPPYFRAFHKDGAWFALAMPGRVFRSSDGLNDFVEGPNILPLATRHSAIALDGNHATIVYTSVGDNPEHLQGMYADLRGDWDHWRIGESQSLLRPDHDYEGADCEAIPSARGLVTRRERQLRDPALFVDEGTTYLFYAVAGERGIALARLDIE
jgi:hypothetical protein